ncbi:MAG: hypothetical protein HY735_30810 [Verrucomicrobia bacterium]|nr:hypothetical protein [Verrucomicrobiota bacterium]
MESPPAQGENRGKIKGAHLDSATVVFSLSHDAGVGEGRGEGKLVL